MPRNPIPGDSWAKPAVSKPEPKPAKAPKVEMAAEVTSPVEAPKADTPKGDADKPV